MFHGLQEIFAARNQTRRYLLVACVMMVITSSVYADVLPPSAREAAQRFMENKDIFDRTDQYCQDKKVSAACEIPGTAFEGGGKGKCERNFNRVAGEIDLYCSLDKKVAIDRRVPEGPFRRDPQSCKESPDNPSEHQPYSCVSPPLVADRFCTGHKINDTCAATFTVAGKEQTEEGFCELTTEEVRYYHRGYNRATRPVLMCMPKTPAPSLSFRRVPLSSKLMPW